MPNPRLFGSVGRGIQAVRANGHLASSPRSGRHADGPDSSSRPEAPVTTTQPDSFGAVASRCPRRVFKLWGRGLGWRGMALYGNIFGAAAAPCWGFGTRLGEGTVWGRRGRLP